jgi:hypothetical protein
VLVELRPGGRGLEVLVAVDEPERVRIEERELLLDGDGEVGAALERLTRRRQLLLGCPTLLFADWTRRLTQASHGTSFSGLRPSG